MNNKTIKVYIVLSWYWDGDGYLVHDYRDCFLKKHEAVSLARVILLEDEFYSKNKNVKIYNVDEEIPKIIGGGCSESAFLQIIEKTF